MSREDAQLKDATAVVRDAARNGDLDTVVNGLSNTDWRVRLAAADALGKLRDPRAAKDLERLLNTRDELLQSAATKALGEIGDPGAAGALYEAATKAPSYSLRFTAMIALARVGDERGSELLADALTDAELAQRTDEPAARFKASPRVVRKEAARTLVALNAVGAIPTLEEAARHAGLRERIRLHRTIRKLRASGFATPTPLG